MKGRIEARPLTGSRPRFQDTYEVLARRIQSFASLSKRPQGAELALAVQELGR